MKGELKEKGLILVWQLSRMEKAMATHSSTLAWKIPWVEEPSRLQSMGSLRIGHNWVTSLSLFTFMHWRRKWQPTTLFLPGESQGRGSLVGCRLWGCTESDMTERLHFHFSLSCIGEGKWHSTPVLLPGKSMDGGAWWAAVHGVAKSRTWLSNFTFTFYFHALEKEMATHYGNCNGWIRLWSHI